jgi:NAD(P)-dependent dehydrogenase (short-subunit alcohol dehydrogenase family)
MSAELRIMRVAKSDVGGGSMVNAASIVGLVGKPKCSVYCASKHAVIGITKAVAKEEASTDIRINAIALWVPFLAPCVSFVVAFSACRTLGGACNLHAITSRAAPYLSSALCVSPLLVLGLALFSHSSS